jgi:hypothetical protein
VVLPSALAGWPARGNHELVYSLAIRRGIYARHPFPTDRNEYIGQCLTLMDTLRRNGIVVYMNPRARVAHPPPTFVRSAFINGYDAVVRGRRAGERGLRPSYWRLQARLAGAVRRLRAGRRDVGLGPWQTVVAAGIAIAYHSLWFTAEILTVVMPAAVRRLYAL